MIIQKTKKIVFPITRYYFNFNGFKNNIFNPFSISEIIQSKNSLKLNGFEEEIFHTGIINLKESEDIIFGNFSSTIRNEINRAKKEGILYKFINNFTEDIKNEYICFYNNFANIKRLPKINNNYFYGLNSNIYLTKAYYNNLDLVYHLYIYDEETFKIRLLQSCSYLRNNRVEINKNLIGYSNKGLHYFDIINFKKLGFLEYDFGGLYLGNDNIEKINIDKFKLSFGPKIETNYNYIKYGAFIKLIYLFLGKK